MCSWKAKTRPLPLLVIPLLHFFRKRFYQTIGWIDDKSFLLQDDRLDILSIG